jgi:dTDP-4-amino-4,6-dideoxygalactose transaminase
MADPALAVNGGEPLLADVVVETEDTSWRESTADVVRDLVAGGRTFGWFGGPVQRDFEDRYAAWAGAGHGVMVSSGTAALQLLMAATGVGRGDTVGVPSFGWYSTVGAIMHSGARPFLLRTDPATHQIDVDAAVEELPPGAYVLVVHNLGRAIDVADLRDRRGDLTVLEDACEAQSTAVGGEPVGNVGRGAVWSFTTSHNEVHAAGSAGMVTTSDEALAALVRRLAHYGKPSRLEDPAHGLNPMPERLGFNAMTSEVEAAVARATLADADANWALRRACGRALHDGLAALGLDVPATPAACDANFYDVVFSLDAAWVDHREWVFRALMAEGCPAWTYHSYLTFPWFRDWMRREGHWDDRTASIVATDAIIGRRLLAIKPPRSADHVAPLLEAVAKVMAIPAPAGLSGAGV